MVDFHSDRLSSVSLTEQAQSTCRQQASTIACQGDLDGVESEDENFGLQHHSTDLCQNSNDTIISPKITLTQEDEI